MAINSAMYTAVTGLSALSTGMQTISNNIANVNTVGFKAGRTNYEDLISQNYFSGGQVNQRGCGVKVSTIQSMFTQGAFMSSAQDTDMAIVGEGFFSVRNAVTGAINYTRAGVFTLTKEGQMEDPSGNILQGWQMSIPKPGEPAVRIGAPTDIKITVLNAPPVETSHMKVVTNLNADDDSAYDYKYNEMAHQFADPIAKAEAELARQIAADAVWTSASVGATVGAVPGNPTISPNADYNKYFVEKFEKDHNVTIGVGNMPFMWVVPDGTTITATDRANGWMTQMEFDATCLVANKQMQEDAIEAGKAAQTIAYDAAYKRETSVIEAQLYPWQLEGHGFAAAWNAQESPYIDPTDYTHPQAITIYDSLGSEHKMMIYFQPNPHMDNVWDYIITCDPLEDARKDGNHSILFTDSASFSGLIQKGKITFTADGKDRHGGVIKDIEAQNLDMNNTKMATIDQPVTSGSSKILNASVGGYYKAKPQINPSTGVYESSSRTYDITWAGTLPGSPPVSGFTWVDSDGNTGSIPINDVNTATGYTFGSGLTLNFDMADLPLSFKPGDTLQVTAHSEQIVWTNIKPNKDGYFDFDVAFVQSASMALHPPYPSNMPTVTQNIALDMGAKNPLGMNDKWTLDEQSTTQYATKSSTIFAGQDGYPAGSLQRVSIGEDGVVTGIYSNGRQQALYQVGLTRFLNPWGLSKIGDNLFAATNKSGEGAMNEPGYGGTGTVLANFLEQSNVDVAEEIVNMIITQRGFQANSKTVTTTDTMLAEVIEMKR